MSKVNVSTGLSFPSALFLVFMTLKLTGHVGWSWWWVTSPVWIMVLLVLAAASISAWADM